MTRSVFTTAIVISLVRLILFHGSSEKAMRDGNALIFKPTKAIQAVCWASIVFFLPLSVWSLYQEEEWWIPGLFVAFAVLTLFCWPPTLVVTKQSIVARHLFSRQTELMWPDVDAVQRYDNPLALILK